MAKWWRPGRPGSVRGLLEVALAPLRGTRSSLADILAELAPCPPLPQQIPALIESLLDRPQGRVLFLGRQLASGKLFPQIALGVDELVDAPDYLRVVHLPNPSDRKMASLARLGVHARPRSLRLRRCRAPAGQAVPGLRSGRPGWRDRRSAPDR